MTLMICVSAAACASPADAPIVTDPLNHPLPCKARGIGMGKRDQLIDSIHRFNA
jgi:hypothetical protein